MPAVGPSPDVGDDPAAEALSDELRHLLQAKLDELLGRTDGAGHAVRSVPLPVSAVSGTASLAVAVRDGWRVAELRRHSDSYSISLHAVELPRGVDERAAEARLVAATMSIRVALRAHDAGREVAGLEELLGRGLRAGEAFSGRHPRWADTGLRTGTSELVARRHQLEAAARALLYPVPLPRIPVSDLPVMRPVGLGTTRAQLASAIRVHLRHHGIEARIRLVASSDSGILLSYLDGPPTWVMEHALRHVEDLEVSRQNSTRAALAAIIVFHLTYNRPPTTSDDLSELERWLAFGDVLTLVDRDIKRRIRAFTKEAGGLVTPEVPLVAQRYAQLHTYG